MNPTGIAKSITSFARSFHKTNAAMSLSELRNASPEKLKEYSNKKIYEQLELQIRDQRKELSYINAKVSGLQDILKQNERILRKLVAANNSEYFMHIRTSGNQPFPPVNSF